AGEVDFGFFGLEVHVAKSDNAFDWLFEDLRAPTGLRASIVTFAAFEAELLKRAHQIEEMTPRGAKGVMIVIGPTEAELVLARFLDVRGAIAALPISALLLEDDVA